MGIEAEALPVSRFASRSAADGIGGTVGVALEVRCRRKRPQIRTGRGIYGASSSVGASAFGSEASPALALLAASTTGCSSDSRAG